MSFANSLTNLAVVMSTCTHAVAEVGVSFLIGIGFTFAIGSEIKQHKQSAFLH